MYSPVHATAGLLIAQAMPNPTAAVLAGVVSHYLLDFVPHGDTGVGPWMTAKSPWARIALVEVVDLGLAALVILQLIARHPTAPALILAAGAVGGILPDLLWGLRFVLEKLRWPLPLLLPFLRAHHRWHSAVHCSKQRDIPLLAGLAYQAILVAAVFLLRV